MPELPEVHTISSDLNKNIKGYVVTGVIVENGYKTTPPGQVFVDTLINKKIIQVGRLAKNILIYMSGGQTLVFHLAMSGRILLKNENIPERWTRITITLKKGTHRKNVFFTDMRKFGKAKIYENNELANLKSKYGEDALSDGLDAVALHGIMKKKKTVIKNFLMNQKFISGLGNIYATDALFLAKIHPETVTGNLTVSDISRLILNIKEILAEGIQNRGATMRDKLYIDIFGHPGNQQNNFRIFMRDKCSVCGEKVIYKKVSGRGTYICTTCQKLL